MKKQEEEKCSSSGGTSHSLFLQVICMGNKQGTAVNKSTWKKRTRETQRKTFNHIQTATLACTTDRTGQHSKISSKMATLLLMRETCQSGDVSKGFL